MHHRQQALYLAVKCHHTDRVRKVNVNALLFLKSVYERYNGISSTLEDDCQDDTFSYKERRQKKMYRCCWPPETRGKNTEDLGEIELLFKGICQFFINLIFGYTSVVYL